ncbi:MAG TPA: HAD-IA family hydrolase [Actinomycetes bacterium]|nr:HAD-IA family hydrolase [Actinomycetes bacterium]
MSPPEPGPVRAVFLDIGETLVDETGIYGAWADWLRVPRLTFAAVLGGVIARGEHQSRVFEHFRPGFDLEAERAVRAAAGRPEGFGEADLYPDVRPCLLALRAQGLLVGVAGNQPARAQGDLEALDLPVDVLATSAGWGVEKPDPGFFARVAAAAGRPAAQVAYVGDRVDNDVRAARAAGMLAVFLRRGPWGHLLAGRTDARRAHLRVDALTELPDALAAWNRRHR